jgi:hypothetical protein
MLLLGMDYSYQTLAAEEVLKNALNPKYIASVLAACPSSGKTTISHIIINKYLDLFPDARTMVLTEGQNVLKSQYLEELKNPKVPINFTFGDFKSNAQVKIGIPQNIDNYLLNDTKEPICIDLLIVDESHRFYLADMDQKIIQKFHPKHIILLTGSPTQFNKHNADNHTQYGIYYISAEMLQEYGIFSKVNMDVIREDPTDIPMVWNKIIYSGANLNKIMIACDSINQANNVGLFLKSIGRKILISTSKNDKDGDLISLFKNTQDFDTLLVVNRGILGLNDSYITTAIDWKNSTNVDVNYQFFARVLRVHSNKCLKTYFRIGKSNYNDQVLMLHRMEALMRTDIFKGFTGNNLRMNIEIH